MSRSVAVQDFLARCTVRIVAPSGGGTGFFIAPGLVVTCAHVIEDPANGDYPLSEVQVVRDGGAEQASVIRYASSPDPDLAVLETGPSASRCAYLFEAVRDDDPLYVCGVGPASSDPVRLLVEGSERRGHMLRLRTAVPAGLSGAPILNLRTGAVCGIVSSAGEPPGEAMAAGTSVSEIERLFPGIKRTHDAHHLADPKWFECREPSATVFAARSQVLATRRLCASPIQPLLVPRTGPGPLEVIVPVCFQELTEDGFRHEAVDIDAVLERSRKRERNLLVVGPTGSGRSSVLRMVGHRLAESFPNLGALDRSGVFPILLRANQLAKDGGPVEDQMLRALRTNGPDQPALPAGFLKDLAESPGIRLLLMIDGVDEIQDSRDLAELVDFIRRTREDAGFGARTGLLVTARPSAVEHFRYSEFDVYEIQPLNRESIGLAAERWLGESARGFLETNRRQVESGLLSSPLALAVALKLYETDPRELPSQVVGLYGQLVSDCEQTWRSPALRKKYGPEVTTRAAEALGFLALELLRSTTDMNRDWTAETVRRFLAEHQDQAPPEAAAERFLKFFAEDSLFLQPAGRRFYWSHLAFRDFFAASRLVELSGGDGVNEIRRRWFDANWGRAPAYALELLPDSAQRLRLVDEILASGRGMRLEFVARLIRDGADLPDATLGRLIDALIEKARSELDPAAAHLSGDERSGVDVLLSLAHLEQARTAFRRIVSEEGWPKPLRERLQAELQAAEQ